MAFSLALGVTPELLKQKAIDVANDVDDMKTSIRNMYEEVMRTDRYWKGEAGEMERKKFTDNVDQINQIMDRMADYAPRITQIAGFYKDAEEFNKNRAAGLKTDIEMV